MKRIAVEGTGLSPWEAEVLIESIDEVYFSDPELKGLNAGQLKYSCVSADEGAGKPLSACRMTTVMLTLIDAEDRHELPPSGKLASVHRRQRKIMRLTDEAREQGGLLTQEDLAAILDTDVRTVRRDIRDLDQAGVTVATRGQQKDIGPGVSHRGAAIRLWLEGKEPVEIARQIKHSIKAVENYLEKFKRVAYLRRRNFDDYQIALTVGMSVSAVKTYVQIYTDSASRTFLKSRMEEMELVGQQNYFAQDEKKDSTLSKSFGKGGMLR
jgi:DNA-binding CsgD family transcriptional regulator